MRASRNRLGSSLAAAVALALTLASTSRAEVVYATPGSTYSQTFDALASTGAGLVWTNDTTLKGWSLFTAAGSAITTYDSSAGSGLGLGKFYSFGPASNSDRALGGIGSSSSYFGNPASGAVAGYIAVAISNSTGVVLNSFTLQFDGEQWRNGGNASAQTMVMQYGFGSTFATVPNWTAPGGTYDWTSPVVGSLSAAVDGNVAGLVANRGGAISNLSWAPGTTLWVRWVERNDIGNNHGLAIDNVAFSATANVAVPEASAFLFGGLVAAAAGCTYRRRQRA